MINKIKLILLLGFSFFSFNVVHAQSSAQGTKGEIGISYSSFGTSHIFNSNLIGAEYSSEHFFTFGVNYLVPIKRWLKFETGFEYSVQTVTIRSHRPLNTPTYSEADLTLINIPLTLQTHFSNYFFVNGGLIVDIDVSERNLIDKQIGLGGVLGIGSKYDFNRTFSVFINPYLKQHSLITFAGQDQKIFETGFRFGVVINLN